MRSATRSSSARSSPCGSRHGRRAPSPSAACSQASVRPSRFAVSSRRVAVTFFTVLLVSTFSFNFDVLLPLVAQADARPGRADVRADRLGVRVRRSLRRDDPRHRRQDAPAARPRRRARLRRLPAPARPTGHAPGGLRAPLPDGHLLHPLGVELRSRRCSWPHPSTCAGARPACTSSPSWAARRSAG